MAKTKTVYVCSACGYENPKWSGRCPACGEWNTMNEELPAPAAPLSHALRRTAAAAPLAEIDIVDEHRYHTGIGELDRVLGGGIVKGSVVLLSGDPGIGKSTILLQICGQLDPAYQILYVSGEESARQLKLRAQRLHVNNPSLMIMAETDVQAVAEYIRSTKPDLVMIDSIQTMNLTDMNSSPGSVSQVRECTNLLMRTGKELDLPVIIVGHVNKDGAIAGPKVMEHIVDAVLYFEGDRNHSYRILRAIKNRYGSTNEIGVFEMLESGLHEVENPSGAMLSGRMSSVSGSCIACVLEGSRPILAEVQGLVTASGFGNPRRMATGFDHNRMNLLLAVLEKRSGYFFANLDAYLNVVGGLRLDEPAADLAVALALVSGLKDKPIPDDVVAFGEIGLSGELRSVGRASARVVEAARLGFGRCLLPLSSAKQIARTAAGDIPDSVEVLG
ncbi:MAG: DNA repair protein RadA, partial [Clostridiales bacterium]|nr:DNA repair protein RadA [Clostridiales bacterium]